MYHCLLISIYGQSLVFYALAGNVNDVHVLYLLYHRVIGRACLAFCGHDSYLRVEGREESCYEVAEAIEYAHHYHHGHGGYCHSNH